MKLKTFLIIVFYIALVAALVNDRKLTGYNCFNFKTES